MLKRNTFDIDGVITIGLFPGPNDFIITGRSFEEIPETNKMLISKNIINQVFYNNLPFDKKTRETSGQHKANTILRLIKNGEQIETHFEDDEIQIEEMKKIFVLNNVNVNIVHISHNLTEKENVRHLDEK